MAPSGCGREEIAGDVSRRERAVGSGWAVCRRLAVNWAWTGRGLGAGSSQDCVVRAAAIFAGCSLQILPARRLLSPRTHCAGGSTGDPARLVDFARRAGPSPVLHCPHCPPPGGRTPWAIFHPFLDTTSGTPSHSDLGCWIGIRTLPQLRSRTTPVPLHAPPRRSEWEASDVKSSTWQPLGRRQLFPL